MDGRGGEDGRENGVYGKKRDRDREKYREPVLTAEQVEYFKKQRVVNYQKEQTIKKIEREGGEIVAPQLPTRSSS